MSAALRAALASVDQELGYLTTRVEHLRAARTSLAALLGDEAQQTLAEPVASAGKGQDATEAAVATAPPASADPSPTPPRRVSRGVGAADGAKPRRRKQGPTARTYRGEVTLSDRIIGLAATLREPLTMAQLGTQLGVTEACARSSVNRARHKGLVSTGFVGKTLVLLPTSAAGGKGIPEVVPVPPSTPPSPPVPRPAPPAPKADERRTIKVDGITTREDRFKCLPFACTLTAGSCLDRQGYAKLDTKGPGSSSANEARRLANAYTRCRDCAQGREVAKRLGGAS